MNGMAVTDSFGVEIKLGDEVFFAGTDHGHRPTLNRGHVEEINPNDRKVLVLRNARTGTSTFDSEIKRVWVEISKVGVVVF